jgi:hypothetical protein
VTNLDHLRVQALDVACSWYGHPPANDRIRA